MTTICSLNNKTSGLIYILMLLTIAFISAQENLDFAEHLFFDGDYYRAITEYKRERFVSIDPETDFYCSTRIISALRLSQKYEDSLRELYRLGAVESYSSTEKEWILTNFALNYYGLRLLPNASPFLDAAVKLNPSNPRTILYHGLFAAEMGSWAIAKENFSKALALGEQLSEQPSIETSVFAINSVKDYSFVKKRSPRLAGGMSTIFPGLGQLYSGHWFDAMQALTLVGIFGLASHAAYINESRKDGPYLYTGILAGITVSLHFSNIFGAYKTAEYHNKKQSEDFLNSLRTRILALSIPESKFYQE